MAYSTIVIDYEELKDVQSGLTFVHEEISNIESIANRIGEMIGQPEPDLKGAVDSFQSSWDDNRKDIVDASQKMLEAVTKIIDEWTDWDTKEASNFAGAND